MSDSSGPRPEIPYWHLWTDEQGVSHQTRCTLTEFSLKGVGDAAPQWNNKQPRSEATVVYTVQPVGWVGEWHENTAPQWITVLSGRWWIRGSSPLARIRAASKRRAARGIAPAPSATSRPF